MDSPGKEIASTSRFFLEVSEEMLSNQPKARGSGWDLYNTQKKPLVAVLSLNKCYLLPLLHQKVTKYLELQGEN